MGKGRCGSRNYNTTTSRYLAPFKHRLHRDSSRSFIFTPSRSVRFFQSTSSTSTDFSTLEHREGWLKIESSMKLLFLLENKPFVWCVKGLDSGARFWRLPARTRIRSPMTSPTIGGPTIGGNPIFRHEGPLLGLKPIVACESKQNASTYCTYREQ